jgi:hypothetical protein
MQLGDIMDLFMYSAVRLGAVVLITPVFLLPGLLVGIVGGFWGQVYIRAQLSVKRERTVPDPKLQDLTFFCFKVK